MLASAPDVEHDFVFFHECAHARTGTLDELEANCVGLVDMRKAGRAGRDVEAKLAAYHRRQGYLGEPLRHRPRVLGAHRGVRQPAPIGEPGRRGRG